MGKPFELSFLVCRQFSQAVLHQLQEDSEGNHWQLTVVFPVCCINCFHKYLQYWAVNFHHCLSHLYLYLSTYLCCIMLTVHCVLRACRVVGGAPVEMKLSSSVMMRQASDVHLGRQGDLHCGPSTHKTARQKLLNSSSGGNQEPSTLTSDKLSVWPALCCHSPFAKAVWDSLWRHDAGRLPHGRQWIPNVYKWKTSVSLF